MSKDIQLTIRKSTKVVYTLDNSCVFDKDQTIELFAETPEQLKDTRYSKYYYYDDNLHRENGPAVERANGTLEYYVDGNLHREDGPAIMWRKNRNSPFYGYEYCYEGEYFDDVVDDDDWSNRMKLKFMW